MNCSIIRKEVEKHITEDIYFIRELPNGSYNRVYRIEAKNRNYILRVFPSKNWPEKGKLEFIEKKLKENDIPTAGIIYICRNNGFFPNGYMIQECLEGDDVQDVINIKISAEDYYKKLGILMKKIHRISIGNFGYIGNGTVYHESLTDYMKSELGRIAEDIVELDFIGKKKFGMIRKVIIDNMSTIGHLPSVLVHNDVSSNNVMLVDDELVLIDWDNAIAGNWIQDYACMTYWMHQGCSDREQVMKNKKTFLNSYVTDIEEAHLNLLEKAIHLMMTLKLMLWYRDDRKEFIKTKEYADELYHHFIRKV